MAGVDIVHVPTKALPHRPPTPPQNHHDDVRRCGSGEANPMTPQPFSEFVTSESANFKRIIERANVKLLE